MLKYSDKFLFSSTVYLIFLRFYVMARFGFLKTEIDSCNSVSIFNILLFCIFRHFSFDDCKLYCGFIPGGILNKFLYGEAPPRGPIPYPFIYHFSRKRSPFRIPSIDKWSPFHIPRLELCIPFNCYEMHCHF